MESRHSCLACVHAFVPHHTCGNTAVSTSAYTASEDEEDLDLDLGNKLVAEAAFVSGLDSFSLLKEPMKEPPTSPPVSRSPPTICFSFGVSCMPYGAEFILISVLGFVLQTDAGPHAVDRAGGGLEAAGVHVRLPVDPSAHLPPPNCKSCRAEMSRHVVHEGTLTNPGPNNQR